MPNILKSALLADSLVATPSLLVVKLQGLQIAAYGHSINIKFGKQIVLNNALNSMPGNYSGKHARGW